MPPFETSQNLPGHIDQQSLNMTVGCPHCSKNVSVNVNLTVNHPHDYPYGEVKSESPVRRLRSSQQLFDLSNVPQSEEPVDFEPPDPGQEFQTSAQDETEYSQENPQNILHNIQSSKLELEELDDIPSNQLSVPTSDQMYFKDEVIEIKEELDDYEYGAEESTDSPNQEFVESESQDTLPPVTPRSMLQRAEPVFYQTKQMQSRVSPRIGFGRQRRSPYTQAVMRQRAPAATNVGNIQSSVSQMRTRNFQASHAQGAPSTSMSSSPMKLTTMASSPMRLRQPFGASDSMNRPQANEAGFSDISKIEAQISAHELSYTDSGDPLASTSQDDEQLLEQSDQSNMEIGDPGGDAAAGAPGDVMKSNENACTYCSRRFKCTSMLTMHVRAHTGEKPYTCEVCGKGFSLKANAKQHLQAVHAKHRPYKCRICSKGFFYKKDLAKHSFVHTEGKPFNCNVCLKGFTQKGGLHLHRLKCHSM